MKIGIDARLINETGVGRYIRNLIGELIELDKENSYVLFLPKSVFEDFKLSNERWQKRLADVRWHSVKEQIIMPWLFLREGLDVVHIPYFNIPFLYPGKFVVTIHDLTIMHLDTGRASTLPLPLYKLRRIGYHLILSAAIGRASKIIAVSEVTKKEILKHFDVLPEHVVVTYEGVDEKLKVKSDQVKLVKPKNLGEYFLYVGNVYPHKNVEVLIHAFEKVDTHAKLVLVGRDDYFYQRLKKEIPDTIRDRVVFPDVQSDNELRALYSGARALIFPSKMEGFGLPALEALALGCPVIVSDIPIFHEILEDVPLYFSPTDEGELATHMKTALSKDLKTVVFEKKAADIVKRFSWKKMAEETRFVYEQS